MTTIQILAESNGDGGGGLAVLIIIIIIFAVLKKESKPKGKWVYVEEKKKGCLIILIGIVGILASSGWALASLFR